MAKKKTKKKKSTPSFLSRVFLGSGKKPKKTRRKKTSKESPLVFFFKIAMLILILAVIAGIGWGFKYLEVYVVRNVRMDQEKDAFLSLVDKPEWVNHELESRVFKAAKVTQTQSGLAINEKVAKLVAQNVRKMEWLDPDTIRVRTKHNGIEISGEYRKPVVYLSFGGAKQYYVDQNLYLLSYIPMPHLRIVEIKGFDKPKRPVAGNIWRNDDVDAAITLVQVFSAMDKKRNLSKPFLSEIAYIDVKDYGSRNVEKSQLTLVAKDNTRIRWGAPVGKASVYLEASESEKLEKIYSFYEQYGTVQGVVKYIDPRVPERSIPLP